MIQLSGLDSDLGAGKESTQSLKVYTILKLKGISILFFLMSFFLQLFLNHMNPSIPRGEHSVKRFNTGKKGGCLLV